MTPASGELTKEPIMFRSRSRPLVAAIGLLVAAGCSGTAAGPNSSRTSDPVAGAAATAGSAGGRTSLVAAAAAVKDACSLMPMDLAASIVPNASPPQSQQFPPYKCTISNGTSVLEVASQPTTPSMH